jgi:hypothetical protein
LTPLERINAALEALAKALDPNEPLAKAASPPMSAAALAKAAKAEEEARELHEDELDFIRRRNARSYGRIK